MLYVFSISYKALSQDHPIPLIRVSFSESLANYLHTSGVCLSFQWGKSVKAFLVYFVETSQWCYQHTHTHSGYRGRSDGVPLLQAGSDSQQWSRWGLQQPGCTGVAEGEGGTGGCGQYLCMTLLHVCSCACITHVCTLSSGSGMFPVQLPPLPSHVRASLQLSPCFREGSPPNHIDPPTLMA